ncbi:hypothetical protein T4B_8060 [Trichinella pseudospiralis]|uniref:Uncharacterized protein n=1 Tax=Trichinella pseudospiralis TaxID=6337 RepID=A0A0V1IGK1_TRIPS|nr:hypothetical protein T4B_8060 [Trichinella pseudospiralis]
MLKQDHESRRVLINKLKHQRQFENTVAVCVLQICVAHLYLHSRGVWFTQASLTNGASFIRFNIIAAALSAACSQSQHRASLVREVKLFFQLKVILYLNRLSFFVKAFLSNPSSS